MVYVNVVAEDSSFRTSAADAQSAHDIDIVGNNLAGSTPGGDANFYQVPETELGLA